MAVSDGAIVGGFFAALAAALIILGMQECAARLAARSEYQGRIEKDFTTYLGIFVRNLIAIHSSLMIIVMIIVLALGYTEIGFIIFVIAYAVISYGVYWRFVKTNEILKDLDGLEDIAGIAQ